MELPIINHQQRAIIIGAGVSGLQMANLLQDKGFEVLILEAKSDFGGRIRQNKEFADFPIELGAEEVHGENSYHYQIAKKHGGQFVDESKLHYYIEYNNQFGQDDVLANTNPAVRRVIDLTWNEIVAYDDNKPDISLNEYLKQTCLSEDLHHAVDGILGREFATDLDKLSVKGLKRWNQGWGLGRQNFLLKNMSNYEVISKEYANVLDKVLLNTPVASITYQDDQMVSVKDKSGRTYVSDIVIVTIPISQLKKGVIKFVPDLPEIKKKELQKINMEPAMKMMLRFKERPWAEDLGNIVTTGHITLAWPSSTDNKSKVCHVLTCLFTDKVAAKLSNMNQRDAANLVLEDLKRVYGDKVESDFEGFVIQDWTKEEYIEGGYTFPSIHEDENTRKILAEPLSNKVFFAGEGVSTKFGTISGAIDSSLKAFQKICELVPQEQVIYHM